MNSCTGFDLPICMKLVHELVPQSFEAHSLNVHRYDSNTSVTVWWGVNKTHNDTAVLNISVIEDRTVAVRDVRATSVLFFSMSVLILQVVILVMH